MEILLPQSTSTSPTPQASSQTQVPQCSSFACLFSAIHLEDGVLGARPPEAFPAHFRTRVSLSFTAHLISWALIPWSGAPVGDPQLAERSNILSELQKEEKTPHTYGLKSYPWFRSDGLGTTLLLPLVKLLPFSLMSLVFTERQVKHNICYCNMLLISLRISASETSFSSKC